MEIYTNKGKYKCTRLGEYSVLKTLGEGATSKIKLGQDDNGNQVALKILKGKYALGKDKGTKAEVDVLSQVNHPNIIRVYDVKINATEVKPSGKKKKKTFIVLELAEGGELFDYVAQSGPYDDSTCRYYFNQLLGAVATLHKLGYAHRDLKPENLLYDKEFQLKVADFGFSAMINKEGDGLLYTMLGTQGYMAPEIHEKKPYEGAVVDIFACGVILFIMKSGHPPFGAAKQTDPYYKLWLKKHKKFWKFHEKSLGKGYYSEDFKQLLNKMFEFNKEDRLTVEEIMDSGFMNGDCYSKSEILEQFEERCAVMEEQRAAECDSQQMDGEQGYGGKVFRKVKKEALTGLDLTEVYESLGKTYPNIKSEGREVQEYVQCGTPGNYHLIKADIQDVFEFLLAVLNSQKKGMDTVTIDEEDFQITANFFDKKGEVGMMMNLYQKGKDTVAIEFKKTKGDLMDFFDKTKTLKKQFLSVLAKSNEEKEVKAEESKQDN